MASWKFNKEKPSLKLRFVFALIASLISTILLELFQSFDQEYVFDFAHAIRFFVINFIFLFLISYYTLKWNHAKQD